MCVKRLEEYYDEEEEGCLHWIRNFFYSAMCIGIISYITYVFPSTFIAFVIIYTIYYAYILSVVNNYRTEALFLVLAINEDVMERESTEENQAKMAATVEEELKLEQALERWSKDMRYLEKDISIDETAVELGVTRHFLTSYFSTHKSTNFRKWRLELRIQEAERILREDPSVSISRLHEIVGFNDRSNFYRNFTQLSGKTPAQYKSSYNQ